MISVGLVGVGAMGSALGAGWLAGGAEVRVCTADRSNRSLRLARAAGITLVPDQGDVVACDVVVSVVPPGSAPDAARTIADAAGRIGVRPLVVDLNAISPATVRRVAGILAAAGLDLVDGSISGAPPSSDRPTRVYVSGPAVRGFLDLPNAWLDVVELAGPIGTASALKMCTASMYKGTKALVIQALVTARRHGVVEQFLADTARVWPDDVPQWPTDVALAASKAQRFVDEMREIAATQRAAGLPAELFDGVAAVYEHVAQSPLARVDPEVVDASPPVDAVLAGLTSGGTEPRRGVLFDFSGTLFHIESAQQALLAALGTAFVDRAAELTRFGAINGSSTPDVLPDHLREVWERRDLSAQAHRAAYSGLAVHAGLSREQADQLYQRGVAAEAWHPFADTVAVLRTLHEQRVPVAIVSNIGWDPVPVLRRYGVERDLDALVLSYERGVQKPDPAIFRLACDELGVTPADAVMIGDNPEADGAAAAVGIRFVRVSPDPGRREPDELSRAVRRLA